jgi:hypothetical protein
MSNSDSQAIKFLRFDDWGKQLVVFPSMFGNRAGWAVGHTTNWSPEAIARGHQEGWSTISWYPTKEGALEEANHYNKFHIGNAHLNHHIGEDPSWNGTW